jgi:succinate dehydrogenase/fumarate reductase-like Fe-S protein
MAAPAGVARPDPRRTHMDKFQRRFAHKFWHDVTVNGMLGCVGCGRCFETCPGSIDLRRVITAIRGARVGNA